MATQLSNSKVIPAYTASLVTRVVLGRLRLRLVRLAEAAGVRVILARIVRRPQHARHRILDQE